MTYVHDPLNVVIPCWGNYTEGLARAIRSCPPGSAVVVGDDPAQAVARTEGAWSVPLPRYARHPGAARNLGIAWTHRPFVSFLDADDFWLPGGAETLVEALVSRPDHVAAVGLFERSTGSLYPPLEWARAAVAEDGMAAALTRNAIPSACGAVIRRSLLPATPLFPDLAREDWHAGVALRAAGPVVLVEQPVVHYEVREGSRSRTRTALRARQVVESMELLVESACAAAGPERADLWRAAEVTAAGLRDPEQSGQ